ncbi:hypothetical protein BP6252_13156 [Coleophoma cylindrospora]|uniref:Uncharacterized protein n=1 Tax=Coleophoma cylindrospora TaxID=1849047 RepID=A0A3D8QAI3_9HELO|nr:hypothetical protein BP6252_13156 [Coleophoma cylindrospora]
MPLRFLNTNLSSDTARNGSLKLTALSKTDIFASPTIGYHFSSPVAFVALPTQDFALARSKISIPYTLSSKSPSDNPTLQFDQAGIVVVLPSSKHPEPSKHQPGTADPKQPHPKWVKVGVEVWEENGYGSVVARDRWSDWSLFDVEKPDETPSGKLSATFELERMVDALMIYRVTESGRVPVRKVPWWFLEGETEETMWIGVYVARPDPFDQAGGKLLDAEFDGFIVKDIWGTTLT